MDKAKSSNTKSLAEIKESIKERADLSAIVGRHTKLIKSGRGFKGCCPLPGHKERTPSFHIDSRLNLYFCYGCNRGGDVFTFLQIVEGLPFMEALKELGQSMGIDIPKSGFTKTENEKEKGERERGYEILARASKFFHRVLMDRATPGAEKAYEYLKTRGIHSEEIEKLELGWAPEKGSPLLKRLRENGPDEYDAGLAAGLIREYGDRAYDFFQDRLMIPIQDARGRVVAFSGRTLGTVSPENPKYKNSPESHWFKKKETVYGLDRAAKNIRDENFVCIVEGYFDQWAFERHDIPAVAVMGTALTEDHLRLLGRHTKQVILVLDADAAGVNSTKKSLPLLLSQNWDVKVFSDLNGKDPDEWLSLHAVDVDEIKRKLRSAPESLEWWAKILLKEAREKNQNRLQTLKGLVEVWRSARSIAHQSILADEIARDLGLSPQEIKDSLSEQVSKTPAPKTYDHAGSGDSDRHESAPVQNVTPRRTTRPQTPMENAAEQLFVWWLRHFDELRPPNHEEWERREKLFMGTPAEALVLEMSAAWYQKGGDLKREDVLKSILASETLSEGLRAWILKGLVDPGFTESEDAAKILISFNEFAAILDREKVNTELSKLNAEIRATASDSERTAQLLQKVQDLRMSLEKRK